MGRGGVGSVPVVMLSPSPHAGVHQPLLQRAQLHAEDGGPVCPRRLLPELQGNPLVSSPPPNPSLDHAVRYGSCGTMLCTRINPPGAKRGGLCPNVHKFVSSGVSLMLKKKSPVYFFWVLMLLSPPAAAEGGWDDLQGGSRIL